MASFSTPHAPVLPWAANALTMAALVATTWWSAIQRPEPPAAEHSRALAKTTVGDAQSASNNQASDKLGHTGSATPLGITRVLGNEAHRATPAAVGAAESGFRPVSYSPRTER